MPYDPGCLLSCQQARDFDASAVSSLGCSSLVLMENAGRGATDVLERLGVSGRTLICCGRGNNAGDGYVIARHLMLRSLSVAVLQCGPADSLTADAQANLDLFRRLRGEIIPWDEQHSAELLARVVPRADWIVDGLLGTGARGAPRAPLDLVIRALNESSARRVALDVPSGLDGDSGATPGVCFRADHTITFLAPKRGLVVASAKAFVGNIEVVDIGLPMDMPQRLMSSPDSADHDSATEE